MFYLHLYQWHLKQGNVCACIDWMANEHVITGLDEWSVSQTLRNLLNYPESSSPRPYFICACGDPACDQISFSIERKEEKVVFRNIRRTGYPPIESVAVDRNLYEFSLSEAMKNLQEFEKITATFQDKTKFEELPVKDVRCPILQKEVPDRFPSVAELLGFLASFPWKQEDLYQELHSMHPSRRFLALRLLYFLPEKPVFPDTHTLLLDENIYVRLSCAYLLNQLGFFREASMKDLFFVLQKRKLCRKRAREQQLAQFLSHPFYLALKVLPQLDVPEQRVLVRILDGYEQKTKRAYAEETKSLIRSQAIGLDVRQKLLTFIASPAERSFFCEVLASTDLPFEIRLQSLHFLRSINALPPGLQLPEVDPLYPEIKHLRQRTFWKAVALLVLTLTLLAGLLSAFILSAIRASR